MNVTGIVNGNVTGIVNGNVPEFGNVNATPPSQYSSPSGSTYPRLGGVRCYWALLTPRFPVPGVYESNLELKFVHPDPVLGSHLARQQMSLVGRDMLEFIHPTEVAQARQDLLGAISGDDDNSGSVTRLRFSRLSRIRKLLGGMPDEIEVPADASKYVEDDDYLIVDFSLSWCADGLILCFFHADKDKDPIADNDPMRKNEGWSNFCGSTQIPQEHVEALADDVCDHVPHECNPPHPPRRVFQIFQTHEDNPYRADKVLYSWPRPRQPGDDFDAPDGSYEYCDYRALLQDIDLTPHIKFEKTHCQSRCLLSFTSYTENIYRVINATIIPYGAIMFVRFQTVEMGPLVPKIESPVVMPPSSAVPNSAISSYRNWDTETAGPPENVHPYSEPPLQVVGPEAYPVSHYDRSRPISHGPVDIRQYDPPSHYPPTSSEYFRMPPLPLPPHLQPQYPPMPPMPTHAPPYGQEQFQHPHPNPAPYTSTAPWQKTAGIASGNITGVGNVPKKPEAGPSSRPMLQPPPGVDGCIWCHTRASPEWRRSDSGIKNMCNACGLRRNRIKSKENGTAKKGKRKQSPDGKST